MIETKKDVQEAASTIFAIVATIFLPLTTVASILGMNTADVRDMSQDQWVFWATGIPLALSTAVLCLWCVGKLGETWAWVFHHMPKARRSRESFSSYDDYSSKSSQSLPSPGPIGAGAGAGAATNVVLPGIGIRTLKEFRQSQQRRRRRDEEAVLV